MNGEIMGRMIGRKCPNGPGGRDCVCCGQAPGKERKAARRTMKRRERQAVQKMIRDDGKVGAMGDETFNGWTNRETWALMLHVTNDQGLHELFREAAGEGAPPAIDRVRELAERLLDPDEYRETFGDEQSPDLRRMAHEVGSLWRVDWAEVVQSLTEGLGVDVPAC